MSNEKKKITWHIVSIKPKDSISTGKNYEAYDLADAYEQWKEDNKDDEKEILVAYSTSIINMPLLRAPEIGAVELTGQQYSFQKQVLETE